MSTNLRDKFAKPVPLKTLQNAEAAATKEIATRTNDNGRVDFHKIEPGDNVHRIAPPHAGCTMWRVPLSRYYLPIEVEVEIDNPDPRKKDKIKKKEIRNRPVFVASVHGKRDEQDHIPRDIVVEYVNMIKIKASQIFNGDPTKIKEYLKPVNGYKEGKTIVNGIARPTTEYVMYSWAKKGNEWKLGRLSIKPSARQAMDALCATVDDEDDMLVTDPFTDIDTGVPIVVRYNKDATQAADYYRVAMYINPKSNPPIPASLPLTDDQLTELAQMDPLEKIYVNVYGTKDFQLAVSGLRNFDAINNYNLFDDEEWQGIVASIADDYPAEDEVEEQDEMPSTPDAVKDHLTSMDRATLKGYIVASGLQPHIKVMKSDSDEDIRNKIRTAEQEMMVEAPSQQEEEEDDLTTVITPQTDLNDDTTPPAYDDLPF